ncbi:hypothetical protein PM082_006480 [Marasmius tenuissimus]|nr:hypothetical protein PM082_006480 [Marasmius tenuissimus]
MWFRLFGYFLARIKMRRQQPAGHQISNEISADTLTHDAKSVHIRFRLAFSHVLGLPCHRIRLGSPAAGAWDTTDLSPFTQPGP